MEILEALKIPFLVACVVVLIAGQILARASRRRRAEARLERLGHAFLRYGGRTR